MSDVIFNTPFNVMPMRGVLCREVWNVYGDENEGVSIHVDQGDIVNIRSWSSEMQNVKTHLWREKKTSYNQVKSVSVETKL